MKIFSFFERAGFSALELALRFPGITKTCAGLLLALALYAIIGQGCSSTMYGSVGTVGCASMADGLGGLDTCETGSAEDFGIDEGEFDPDEGGRGRDGEGEGYADHDGDGYPDGDGYGGEDGGYGRDGGPGYGDGGGRGPRQSYIKFRYTVVTGQWDMIIVVDNSSSMAKEHKSLVSQLADFLNDIKNNRYHIAVITTDISSSPDNPRTNAYYQDGKFIPIGGRLFLTNENLGERPSRQTLDNFERALVREETIACDQTDKRAQEPVSEYDQYYEDYNQDSPQCPSADERAIYALNLAIQNSAHESFFRKGRPLMVVILSDEDERSSRHGGIQQWDDDVDFSFDDYDEPEIFAENVYNRFGPLKKIVVYPIIIPPGDERCLEEQNKNRDGGPGSGRGYYGEEYARLTDPNTSRFGNLLQGKQLSICDRNYSNQLRKVAMDAGEIKVPLPCDNPARLFLYVNGRKKSLDPEIQQSTLIVRPGAVELGADLEVEIVCPET